MPELKEFEFGGDRYFVTVNQGQSYTVFNAKMQLITVREHNRKGFQEAIQEAVASHWLDCVRVS